MKKKILAMVLLTLCTILCLHNITVVKAYIPIISLGSDVTSHGGTGLIVYTDADPRPDDEFNITSISTINSLRSSGYKTLKMDFTIKAHEIDKGYQDIYVKFDSSTVYAGTVYAYELGGTALCYWHENITFTVTMSLDTLSEYSSTDFSVIYDEHGSGENRWAISQVTVQYTVYPL